MKNSEITIVSLLILIFVLTYYVCVFIKHKLKNKELVKKMGALEHLKSIKYQGWGMLSETISRPKTNIEKDCYILSISNNTGNKITEIPLLFAVRSAFDSSLENKDYTIELSNPEFNYREFLAQLLTKPIKCSSLYLRSQTDRQTEVSLMFSHIYASGRKTERKIEPKPSPYQFQKGITQVDFAEIEINANFMLTVSEILPNATLYIHINANN